MGFTLKISAEGVDLLARKIKNVSDLPKDLRPIWHRVKDHVFNAFKRNFDRESGLNKWTALAGSTIADRVKRGFGASPIGQRTGDLKASMTGDTSDSIVKMDKDSAEFGANGWKPVVFQRGRSNQPKRDMLFLNNEDKTKIMYEFRKEVKRVINK